VTSGGKRKQIEAQKPELIYVWTTHGPLVFRASMASRYGISIWYLDHLPIATKQRAHRGVAEDPTV
jgi:hypothetical protein